MMKHEFENLIGYEVSAADYYDIIEPMYMASDLGKEDFVKCFRRMRFNRKLKPAPRIGKMLVRDRSGFYMTPNKCWYHIRYVEVIGTDIGRRKIIVSKLSDEGRKIVDGYHADKYLSTDFDFDYLDCVDTNWNPITLDW